MLVLMNYEAEEASAEAAAADEDSKSSFVERAARSKNSSRLRSRCRRRR